VWKNGSIPAVGILVPGWGWQFVKRLSTNTVGVSRRKLRRAKLTPSPGGREEVRGSKMDSLKIPVFWRPNYAHASVNMMSIFIGYHFPLRRNFPY
jgi:hypothetical protein